MGYPVNIYLSYAITLLIFYLFFFFTDPEILRKLNSDPNGNVCQQTI